MTSVWYTAVYTFAGFNPVAFHIVNLLFIAANIWLMYSLCRRLTDSREASTLAALLFSYHASFALIFFDTGFVCDVVCFFFYFSAFLFYVRIRSQGRQPGALELAACSALYICALNAKEIAVTLPASLLVYEWLYHGLPLAPRKFVRWLFRGGRVVFVTGVLTTAFVIGRGLGGGSLLNNPAYRPIFTWARFMQTSQHFTRELLFLHETPPAAAVLAVWALLLCLAWLSKSRVLQFAWAFIMFSPIPVAFILPRGAPQYYIPYFGWALYAGAGLTLASRRLLQGAPETAQWTRAIALFSVAMAIMYSLNQRVHWRNLPSVALEGEEIRAITAQLHRLRPSLRHGSRVLFLDDPIEDGYQMMFLMRLSYHDNDLVIDRVRFMAQPPKPQQMAAYDYLFDYHLGRFYTSPQPRPQGPEPAIVYQWGRPCLYHVDWSAVSEKRPAHRGEEIISMVQDLGETQPPIGAGKPFPRFPYVRVAAPVEVRIDGKPSPVTLKIGWPDEVNRYRVDFRIPKEIPAGVRDVEIACKNASGPTTPIEVQ
jgi:hypothetical protein